MPQVPRLVQERVKVWMQYTWEQQKSFDEDRVRLDHARSYRV